MRLIHRQLVSHRTFWGIVRVKGGGWRLGFGIGFLEISTRNFSGLWLPRKELNGI